MLLSLFANPTDHTHTAHNSTFVKEIAIASTPINIIPNPTWLVHDNVISIATVYSEIYRYRIDQRVEIQDLKVLGMTYDYIYPLLDLKIWK